MPLRRRNSHVFHRGLYRGQMETVILLKRGDDQQEGTVVQHYLYQCLLPGTKVHGDFIGASKAFYSGEAIEFSVFDEVRSATTNLSTTINHPILTTEGFVPAGSIKPGQHLLCDLGGVKFCPYNIKDTPAPVEEIFESFCNFGLKTIRHRPSVLDFHGDGRSMQGYVDVIGTNRHLGLDRNFQGSKAGSKGCFIRRPLSRPRVGNGYSMGKCFRPTTTGSACSPCSGPPLLRCHSRVFNNFGLASGSKFNLAFLEDVSDSATVDRINSSERSSPLTSQISLNNLFNRQCKKKFAGPFSSNHVRFLLRSKFDSSSFHTATENIDTDSTIFSQVIRRFSGKVSLNKIVNIRKFHYSGPVYDFETTDGYYTASSRGGGVFISNCRRGNISKSGEAIAFDVPASTAVQWLIPCTELRRVGVNYLNVLDRIVDKYQMWWEPESPQNIELAIFDNYYVYNCIRVDPYPNTVLLGIPGVGL